MSAFLLLVGLSLFICGGGMYFLHAMRHEPRWIAGSLLLPVVVPMYYRRYWDELQLAGLLQAAGLVMALAGGLMLAFSPSPGEIFPGRDGSAFSSLQAHNRAGFVDSDRALRLLGRQGPGTTVFGRVNGEAFHPDRVELIDGVLRLREGPGFLPQREIALFLGEDAAGDSRIKRIVGPEDSGPEVQVTWLDAYRSAIVEGIATGYRLDLDLAPTVRGKLSGYIQLTLPDLHESYVAGDIEVITSHLRFRDGEVDRTFDHPDTLHFVAEEYLHAQYKEGDIKEIRFSGGAFDSLEGRADALAQVFLHDGRVGSHMIKAARSEYGWAVLGAETAAATTEAGFKPVYNVLPPEGLRSAVTERAPAKRSAAVPAETTVAFSALEQYTGQGAALEFANGRRETGVLRGLSAGKLLVEALKGGGVVQFRVAEGELVRLRLNSGQVLRMAGASDPAATATAAASGPVEVRVGDLDLTRYVNRSVKVVTTDGKATTGVFRGVSKDRLVVEVAVGGGKVDYSVPASQLASIDFAGR